MAGILIVSNHEAFVKELTEHVGKYASYDAPIRNCHFSDVAAHASKLAPASHVLIDLISPPESILDSIQKIRSAVPAQRIIGVGQPQDASLLMKLIKMGIKDFLSIPLEDNEVKALFDQLVFVPEKPNPASPLKEKEAKVITFYSPKGGAGVTLLTANLSVALASYHNNKVVVCDLAPQCGDISTYLNLKPKYTIRDVLDHDQAMDHSFLEGCLLTHPSGVKILAAPNENQGTLNSDNLNALKFILSLLRKSFDTILIDGSHLNSALLQYIMSNSDLIFLLGNPDVVSLKGLVSCFNKLRSMQYNTEKIKVLINRHPSKGHIDPNEFEKMTKHPISCYLPNDFTLCIDAINTGQPLIYIHEKSDLSKKIAALADLVIGIPQQETGQGFTASARSAQEASKKGIFRCF